MFVPHCNLFYPCIQVQCYFTLSGLLSAFMIMVGGLMFGTLAKFEFGRSLLEAYPRYITNFDYTKFTHDNLPGNSSISHPR